MSKILDLLPFFMACQKAHIEIVKLLLSDPRIRFNDRLQNGGTPILVVAENGNPDLMKLLAFHPGLEVDIPRIDGITPLWIACYRKHLEIVKWLIACGKPLNLSAKWSNNNLSTIEVALNKDAPEIAKLLTAFQRKPHAVRKGIRRELGIDKSAEAAELFALMVMLSDGYFQVSQTSSPSNIALPSMHPNTPHFLTPENFPNRVDPRDKACHFFRFAEKLNMDAQMVLANRVFQRSADIIPLKDSDEAFRKIVEESD